MGIGSIGSVSFWQQDQNYWQNVQTENQTQALSTALITGMGSAVANEAQGLAGIANKTALARVNAQLTAALQGAVQASQAGSTSSSSSGSSAPSSASGSPATGTGTVPLTASTSLLTLGIPPNGTITVSDGTNTTNFASTGTDTVGDLINAINTSGPKNAQVTAWLNGTGQLVIAAQNDTDSVTVGGTFASDVGFGTNNDSFQPTAPSSSTSTSASSSTSPTSSNSSGSASSSAPAASSSSATGGSTGPSSTSTTSGSSTGVLFNSAYALQTGGTAETLLASSGLSGTLVNLLA